MIKLIPKSMRSYTVAYYDFFITHIFFHVISIAIVTRNGTVVSELGPNRPFYSLMLRYTKTHSSPTYIK